VRWMLLLMMSVLGLGKGWGQGMEAPRNLLRNSHFWICTNEGVPDWWGTSAPERLPDWAGCLSVEESSPIPSTRALRLFNPKDGFAFRLQSFAYALPSGKPYTFSVFLRAERSDFPVTLSIGYDRSTTVMVSTEWRRFVFTATPQRGHWATGRLIVSLSFRQAGTLWVAAPQLEAGETATDYTPLYAGDVWLLQTAQPFRAVVQCNAYASEPHFRLWCENNLNEPVTVRCRLGETVLSPQDKAILAPRERRFVAFPLNAVPTGTHTITVEAINGRGEVVATVTDQLTKLAPTQSTFVQIDRIRRHLIVNGQPLLVFAQGIHADPELWWLDDIASHGFNAVIPMIPTDPSTWATSRQFLDEAWKRRLWVIAWLRPPKDRSAPEIASALVRTIQALRDHPAVITWYLLDEPEGWWARGGRKEDELLTVFQAAKQTDPYRPAQLNWFQWTDGKGGYGSLQASDFGSLDHYPFGRVENPMGRVADFLWRMNRDCRPLGKPVAFWQQMYGYDDAVREPTPDEARAHSWLTVITGGRLIYWFIYKPMSLRFWNAMPQIAEEVKRLADIVTADDAYELAVGREGAVHYALWAKGDAIYLATVNASYAPQRVPLFLRWLTGRESQSAVAMVQSGQISLKEGVAFVWLPPLGIGLWRLE